MFVSGCILCGLELVYGVQGEERACALCGARRVTTVTCAGGHYVCDRCHDAGRARDDVERTCLESDERDPVALATTLMRLPSLLMHGPEHHFLVPASLVTAHANVTGRTREKSEWIREARRRAEPVLGGFCGVQGACGAGIGAGIYASIVSGATPLAGRPWGIANGMTARALGVIARVGGPRCCKRTTWLAILSAVRQASHDLGVEMPVRAARCTFDGIDATCLKEACPFFDRRRDRPA